MKKEEQTSIQISISLRKRLKILAAKLGFDYEDLLCYMTSKEETRIGVLNEK